MSVSLQFLGAARFVTGSKHLLQVGSKRILLDCGLVQGPRKMAEKANRHLPLDPKGIDAVVLSHAHVDHSGALPRLVKLGYRGPIHCTHATKDLIELLLADSAHIQQSDARYLAKRGHRYEPLYTQEDVNRTLSLVVGAGYHEDVKVTKDVSVQFLDAGHILGSAMVVLDIDDGDQPLRLAFTGDHGRKNLPILRDHETLPECDVLITESTYGDRLHEPAPDMEAALEQDVGEVLAGGGRVVIPAFSVGRTQNVVLFLGNLMEAGRIPKVPVFVDSPLSRNATRVMARHAELFDDETQAILDAGRSPFFFDGIQYTESVEESKALNDVDVGVIISASGMCEAGRVLHHLKRTVGRPQDCVLMVGYQAVGTLGRRLFEGVDEVKIYGQLYDVRCQTRSIGGFSAHADYQELVSAYGHLADRLEHTFVVHGEEGPALQHAERLEGLGFRDVAVPVQRQKFELRP
jgi:metallo-beta-lactamase family protein